MAREIDERKKRKALRKLRKAADLAERGLGPPLTDWEKTFLEEVEERIETYGSAFADLSKGQEAEALSALQARKLHEIDRKARGKSTGGFKTKKPKVSARVRQINDDLETPAPEVPTTAHDPGPAQRPTTLRLVQHDDTPDDHVPPPTSSQDRRPVLRLVRSEASDPPDAK